MCIRDRNYDRVCMFSGGLDSFVGAVDLLENSHGTVSYTHLKTAFDEEIIELQKQLLILIEENAKQGAVNEDFDEQYRKIAEEMQALKMKKLKQVREQKLAGEYGQRMEGMDSCLNKVSCRVGEFDEDLIRRLILRIKVISESRIEIHFKDGIVMEQEVASEEMCIRDRHHMTIHDRKIKILGKLKKLMEK